MKKAFTIVELLVAMGLLAAVLAGAGVIFHQSIDAQRTAMAVSEIMRNYRAITDQMNSDFEGMRSDLRWAVKNGNTNAGKNADSVVFFANGDFQSVNPYGSSAKPVSGNVASIYYGQSATPNPVTATDANRPNLILARRQTIYTVDTSLAAPNSVPTEEYEKMSLSEFMAPLTNATLWKTKLDELIVRPSVDPNQPEDIPLYIARGVADFEIQLVIADPNIIEQTGTNNTWELKWQNPKTFSSTFPQALKFSFTLYDSKGIISEGRRFSHIVYLGN